MKEPTNYREFRERLLAGLNPCSNEKQLVYILDGMEPMEAYAMAADLEKLYRGKAMELADRLSKSLIPERKDKQ